MIVCIFGYIMSFLPEIVRVALCKGRKPLLRIVPLLPLLLPACAEATELPMLAVAAHDDNAVKLYNVLGGGVLLQAVASVPVGKQPTEMCIAPNGKYLFVSNAGDKNVSMIDVDSKTVTGQLADADLQSPDGCAVSPDSKKLYSVDQAGNAIFVFSTGSKQMLRKIAVGKEPRRAIF